MNLLLGHFIRALLYGLGYFLGLKADDELISEETVQAIVGAVIILGTFIVGLWEKFRLRKAGIKKVKDAERRKKTRSKDPADTVVQSQLDRQAKSDDPTSRY